MEAVKGTKRESQQQQKLNQFSQHSQTHEVTTNKTLDFKSRALKTKKIARAWKRKREKEKTRRGKK